MLFILSVRQGGVIQPEKNGSEEHVTCDQTAPLGRKGEKKGGILVCCAALYLHTAKMMCWSGYNDIILITASGSHTFLAFFLVLDLVSVI